MNLFLIGFRCTGKSSVGKYLSKRTGWPFIDLDSKLVEEQSMTIADIVTRLGWDAFREIEKELVQRICNLDRHVVAAGGGAILDETNVKNMKDSGILVWLKATPETIRSRMQIDQTTKSLRPSLTSRGSIEEIDETLVNRNPLYEKAMDFSVRTDDLGVEEICDIILEKLGDIDSWNIRVSGNS